MCNWPISPCVIGPPTRVSLAHQHVCNLVNCPCVIGPFRCELFAHQHVCHWSTNTCVIGPPTNVSLAHQHMCHWPTNTCAIGPPTRGIGQPRRKECDHRSWCSFTQLVTQMQRMRSRVYKEARLENPHGQNSHVIPLFFPALMLWL